jgi:hypothetical protein
MVNSMAVVFLRKKISSEKVFGKMEKELDGLMKIINKTKQITNLIPIAD